MAPIIIGAAIVGASAIASKGAKESAETQANAQQAQIEAQQKAAADAQTERDRAVTLKQEAIKNTPYPTYLSTPEAQTYKTTLEDRMAGRGLIDVNAQTSPIANQVRAGLKETSAAISSTASARGLGRSTVPVAQIGEKSQAAERDIASRMAELEVQRQNQITGAVGDFGTLTQNESASQQNKASYDRGGEFSVANTIAGNADTVKQDQFAVAETVRGKGTIEAQAQERQANIWASALIGASQSADDLIGAIEKKQQQDKKNAALVKIAGEVASQRGY